MLTCSSMPMHGRQYQRELGLLPLWKAWIIATVFFVSSKHCSTNLQHKASNAVLCRSHSRLQNIEFECWVFKNELPSEAKLLELNIEADNAYYSRITFDPKTLDKLP